MSRSDLRCEYSYDKKTAMFTVHSCKFRQLHDFTGEGVMSYLREHHPLTHDVTRHAEITAKIRDVTLPRDL